MSLIEKVKESIYKNSMFSGGNVVIVAVSGGADSVFLFYSLLRLRHELSVRLHIAHFNHNFRKNSLKDQKFVEALSKKFNIPLTIGRLQKPKPKKGQSLEEFARNARLKFLSQTAKKQRAHRIALGHTKSDLAETVMMRVLRGSGLYGLRAILPVRKIDGQVYVRPLLDITRKEIENFLKKKRIPFRTDETNHETKFFRNKIRLELFPMLKRNYNADIENVLANLSQSVSADYDYLLSKARGKLAETARHSKNGARIKLSILQLKLLHPALQRLLIRLSIEKLKGNTRRITFSHIEQIRNTCLNEASQASVTLPGLLKIDRKTNTLFIATRSS